MFYTFFTSFADVQTPNIIVIQGGAPESTVAFKLKTLKATADSGAPPCIDRDFEDWMPPLPIIKFKFALIRQNAENKSQKNC